jgi:hypothetical protein
VPALIVEDASAPALPFGVVHRRVGGGDHLLRGAEAPRTQSHAARRHVNEESITCGMAEGIVDRLEVIDIEEQDREAGLTPLCKAQAVAQTVPEEGAVRQAGQLIVERAASELPRCKGQLGGPVSNPALEILVCRREFLAEVSSRRPRLHRRCPRRGRMGRVLRTGVRQTSGSCSRRLPDGVRNREPACRRAPDVPREGAAVRLWHATACLLRARPCCLLARPGLPAGEFRKPRNRWPRPFAQSTARSVGQGVDPLFADVAEHRAVFKSLLASH